MLKINDEMMKAFAMVAIKQFETELVDHIKEFAPVAFNLLGEAPVREVIRTGMKRAERHGFTNQGPVRFYIELMFMLGSDFELDPQYSWLSKEMHGVSPDTQMEQADQAFDAVARYVNEVSGAEHLYERQAFSRIASRHIYDFTVSKGNREAEILAHLKWIYPQKAEHVGHMALRRLIQRGEEIARERSLHVEGIFVLVLLMFMFGSGCFTDPQFPWMGEILAQHPSGGAEWKIQRFYSRMLTYFDAISGGGQIHAIDGMRESTKAEQR